MRHTCQRYGLCVLAFLGNVEWNGDFVTGVALLAFALALVGFGFAWARPRALLILAAVWTVPLVGSDLLYFGLGINLVGYCGEPKCDPGPLPATLGLLALPIALVLAFAGITVRARRSATPQ